MHWVQPVLINNMIISCRKFYVLESSSQRISLKDNALWFKNEVNLCQNVMEFCGGIKCSVKSTGLSCMVILSIFFLS